MRVSGWLFLMQQIFSGWMLLLALCRWLHVNVRPIRALCVSVMIGLAGVAAGTSPAGRAAVCCLLPAAPYAAGIRMPPVLLRRMALLVPVLTLFCVGLMHALDVSPLPRLLLPACAVLALILPALDARAPSPGCSTVTITIGSRSIRLTALLDSGNLLRDRLTGLSVIVCSRRAAEGLAKNARCVRLISVRTAAGSALMPVFRADRIRLYTHGVWRETRALIGLAPSDYDGFQALVPQSLLESCEDAAAAAPSMQGGSP